MIDENTFVTSAIAANWVAFPGNGMLRVWFPPEVAGRVPLAPIGQVGTIENPNTPFAGGATYAPTAGQLSEFNDVNTRLTLSDSGAPQYGGSFLVTNGTCADYFAWFRVDFVPRDAAAPPSDAGASQEDGAPDGGGASADAGDASDVVPLDVPDVGPPDAADGGSVADASPE